MSIEQLLAAIAIFRKYVNVVNPIFQAEHDVLIGPHEDELPNLTKEDREALETMHWRIGDVDCWEHNCSC